MFENYLIAAEDERNKFSPQRKRGLLLHSIGAEAQRVFYTLREDAVEYADGDDDYVKALKLLESHFAPVENTIAARVRFRKRSQHTNETIDQFVTNLRELAIPCNYGDRLDEMVRDQIVEKTNNPKCQERLLLEKDPSLEKALTNARRVEQAQKESKTMGKEAAKSEDTVHAMKAHHKKPSHRQSFSKPTRPTPFTDNRSCYRCGSRSHLANSKDCRATQVTCHACGKKGHLQKLCMQAKRTNASTVRHLQFDQTLENDLTGCVTTHSVPGPDMHVLSLVNAPKDTNAISCTITMNHVPMRMLVDTGSPRTLISQAQYEKYFAHVPLQPAEVQLKSYSMDIVKVSGTFTADITYKDRLGKVKGFSHKIRVKPDAVPAQAALRAIPFAIREEVHKELDRWEKDDIVEKIDASEWVSPLVVVRKKTGNIRLCVDMRAPNKEIVVDKFPIPSNDELRGELRGAKYFARLDLANAYHQLELNEESRDLTCFLTHQGLYRFKRVPFGLASAPSAFQKMMKIALQGLEGLQSYFDDLVVYGRTWEEYRRNLKAVLRRLSELGIKLNPAKCEFDLTEMEFLGHMVTPEVEPVRKLLRGDQKFEWSEDCQTSFKCIKEDIGNHITLTLFDPDLDIVVTTDASGYGLGAYRSQYKNGLERIVTCASQSSELTIGDKTVGYPMKDNDIYESSELTIGDKTVGYPMNDNHDIYESAELTIGDKTVGYPIKDNDIYESSELTIGDKTVGYPMKENDIYESSELSIGDKTVGYPMKEMIFTSPLN
ncbi:uncharacterized protein K02A2.6-like [Lineus longissimus]|uniref:uncharacterized protein K02A2.6-like n=1 Tax=Lineus longissimus TaxID=88925 RepID=UPI00315C58D8